MDDWIQLYNEAAERLENPGVNYYSRCVFLQTGADVLRGNDRFDEALLEIEKLERANNEPRSEHYFSILVDCENESTSGVWETGRLEPFRSNLYGSECVSGGRVEKTGCGSTCKSRRPYVVCSRCRLLFVVVKEV